MYREQVSELLSLAESVFTITGISDQLSSSMNTIKPEPSDWYSGDIHIHRNCGDGTSVLSETEFTNMMEPNDLAVISVLADMGDGEVKDSRTDLPKVNGKDAVQSKPGRMVHWDAEWHFDPFGTTFEHKALGRTPCTAWSAKRHIQYGMNHHIKSLNGENRRMQLSASAICNI